MSRPNCVEVKKLYRTAFDFVSFMVHSALSVLYHLFFHVMIATESVIQPFVLIVPTGFFSSFWLPGFCCGDLHTSLSQIGIFPLGRDQKHTKG